MGEEKDLMRRVLTEHDVRLIRQLRVDGMMVKQLAEKFDVHVRTIEGVLYRQTWRHVRPEVPLKIERPDVVWLAEGLVHVFLSEAECRKALREAFPRESSAMHRSRIMRRPVCG